MKRLLAYIIDMMIILVITQSLSGVPFLNKQLNDYNKYYQKYTEELKEYSEFKLELTNSYKDEKITEKEYNKIIKEKDNYKQFIEPYYEDQKISQKEYKTINKNIDKYYQKKYQKVYYQVEKNSVAYFVIYLIAISAYFIFFNRLTGGQTLGKKLLRLKIVDAKDSDKKVSLWSYLVRMLILYQPLYYIAKLIGVFTLNSSNYYNVTSIVYDIEYYLEFIVILTILIRADGRGIHDLLARTRVASYDKNGKEQEEQSESFLTKRLDQKIENQKIENKKHQRKSKETKTIEEPKK